MYVGADFSPVDVGEVISEAFDFVNDLAAGDSIASVSLTCSVAAESTAVDPGPASRLLGTPGFSVTVTFQRFSGMLSGVTYLLLATGKSNFAVHLRPSSAPGAAGRHAADLRLWKLYQLRRLGRFYRRAGGRASPRPGRQCGCFSLRMLW
jgi:hypothetical protein